MQFILHIYMLLIWSSSYYFVLGPIFPVQPCHGTSRQDRLSGLRACAMKNQPPSVQICPIHMHAYVEVDQTTNEQSLFKPDSLLVQHTKAPRQALSCWPTGCCYSLQWVLIACRVHSPAALAFRESSIKSVPLYEPQTCTCKTSVFLRRTATHRHLCIVLISIFEVGCQ